MSEPWTEEDERIVEEALAASQAVLDKGTRWLTFHPFQHRMMRRRLNEARAALIATRRRHGLIA